MHKRKPIDEYVDARQLPAVDEIRAPLRLQKIKAQQHHDLGHQQEAMACEFSGQFEWGIGYNGLNAFGRPPFHEEVDTIPDEITGGHAMPMRAQHVDDAPGAATAFPDVRRQLFDAQQRLDRLGRSFVNVISTVTERRAGVAHADCAGTRHRHPRRCRSVGLSLPRGWDSVTGYEEFFAALVNLVTASEGDNTSGAASLTGGPVACARFANGQLSH